MILSIIVPVYNEEKTIIEILEKIKQNSPNLTKIDFAGGEVLHQKQFFP